MSGLGYSFGRPESKASLERIRALIEPTENGLDIHEICAALGMVRSTVATYLRELQNRGHVRKTRAGTVGRVLWVRDAAEPIVKLASSTQCHQPKQATVSAWAPNHCRDPLVAALFGKPTIEKEARHG